MDFNDMKRKELQALCKQHKIPANLSNLEMSKKLTDFFKEKKNSSMEGAMNRHDEIASETESTNLVANRVVKKVRFSPEHELIEFTRSSETKRRSRRYSISTRNSSLSVEKVDSVQSIGENLSTQGRVTRSRGLEVTEDRVNEKTRGRNGDKRNEKGSDDVDGRSTRSKKRGKTVASVDNVDLVSGEGDDDKRVVTRRSVRNRRIETNGKELKEVLETNEIADVHETSEPRVSLRRSNRNVNVVGDARVLKDADTRNNENVGNKGSRKSVKSLTADVSSVAQIEETVKVVEVRRSSRRKDVIVPPVKEVTENKRSGGVSKNEKKVPQPSPVTRRSKRKTSVLEPVAVEEKLDKPYPAKTGSSAVQNDVQRWRRNVSDDMSSKIMDEVVGDSDIQEKNEGRKRRRVPVSGGDVVKTNNNSSALKQPMKGSRNEKAVSFEEAELSESEGEESTSNPGLSGDTSNKNVISDVGLISSSEKQDVSIEDSARRADASYISGNEMANFDENAASGIGEIKIDPTDFEQQICEGNIIDVEKVDSLLEFDGQDIMEQNIIDKSQVISQIDDAGCNNVVDKQIHAKGSNVSGNEFVGTSSTDGSLLLADLEVTVPEADKQTEPSSDAVDRVEEVEGTSVQENLESVEIRQENVDRMEISDDNKEDAASKAGNEVGALESSERSVGSIDSKSALQLKEPSSGNLRSIEGDNTAQGDETHFQDLAETEKDGCLKDDKLASNEDGEFGLPGLFDGERSARITPQPQGRETNSGEYSAVKSGKRSLEADHSEVAEIDEGGLCNKSEFHEDSEFIVTNVFGAERRESFMPQDTEIKSDDNSINDFDEHGGFHNSPSVAPTTICDSAKIKLSGGHEADQIGERDEAYVHDDNRLELGETNEIGSLENHENTKDEDWEFSVSNLFDGEKSSRATPQDRGLFSAEDSINDNEVKISAGSSSLQEMSPSKLDSASKSQGFGLMISDACEISDDEAVAATIQEKEVSIIPNNIQGDEIFMDKNISDGEHETFNEAEITNEYTYEQEQFESPLAKPNAIANNIQGHEACSSVNETTGDAMGMLKTNGEGIRSPFVEGSYTDRDVNDVTSGKDKDEFADAGDISMDYQSENLQERDTVSNVGEEHTAIESNQRWTENEISNLFEDKEMEGERGNEAAKSTNVNIVLPIDCKEVFDAGSSVDREENQLKLLFATPIKTVTPFKVDETSSHGKEHDSAVMSITECVGTTKESAVAQKSKSELEYSLRLGSSSDNGQEVSTEELNEVESVELVNTSTTVLSEASKEQLAENTFDECLKDSEIITEESEEEKIISLGESSFDEEATYHDCELTETNPNSPPGSLRLSDKLESCKDLSIDMDLSESLSCGNRVCVKSERKMAQSSEVAFESCDADIHKADADENSHHLNASYQDTSLSEIFIDTLKGHMDAEGQHIGSFHGEKDEIDKGISPSVFSKATNDNEANHDDPCEAKSWDEKDNSRAFHDISDEPQCNIEVAILESPSVGNNALELHTTGKEAPAAISQNVDNIHHAAEQGFSVCSAAFDVFSQLDDKKNGDRENSEVRGVYNPEGDHERSIKKVEEDSTATDVRYSITELQNYLDTNDDVHSVSDEVTENENGDIEKLDMGTPLFNMDGDCEENDKEVKENLIPAIVQFPISELHLEEKSNYGVPAFGCNEFLKESDVADAIKEYIDLELARIDENPTLEDAALCDTKEDIDARFVEFVGEDDLQSVESHGIESKVLEEAKSDDVLVEGCTADKSSVETKGEEQKEELLVMESLIGENRVHSPACVDLTENSGCAVNDDAIISEKEKIEPEDGHRSSSRRLYSSARKNPRTILIHATPSKVMAKSDMKENAPTHKSSNIGDITAVRPAKRKALQDVKLK